MGSQTSMLHVRVDGALKADAMETLASVGPAVSDAVRIMLTRVVKEGGLPPRLTVDPKAYNAWSARRYRRPWTTRGQPYHIDRP